MIATFFNRGSIPVLDLFHYTVLCDNGVAFDTRETDFISTGTKLVLPDDWCSEDSGWVHWQCSCGLVFWTRSRPGGKVQCPACNTEEDVPTDAIMLPYEGADITDLDDDD